MNIFEVASRNKIRFQFNGLISTEDLWDLSVAKLDSIYKTLNSKVKQSQEESLLNVKTKEDEELSVQIEIIKYIVAVKLEEEKIRLQAKEKKETKQKLQSILATKQDEELLNKSADEIKAMLNELEG